MMNEKPFFSIIIPTYNRGYIISKAIESVLKQNFKDWEIIIVDDGSTDNTKEIIKKYLIDNRIFYFKFKENKGVNAAKNFGILRAKGNYILNLDSDNQFLENSFNILFQILSKEMFPLNFFWVKSASGKQLFQPVTGIIDYKDLLCEKVKGEYFPVVQREVILRFPFDESINGGEGITWKRIAKYLGKVRFYPIEILLYNDLLEDRLSVRSRNFERLAKVFQKHLQILGKEYLKYCPKLFFKNMAKWIFYLAIKNFS
jgi:glycosyltransferase involved in cell wall biosynthesis